MLTDQNQTIEELILLINKGNAHVTFEDAVDGLDETLRGITPENLPYSIWQLVEHVRIAQKDIVDFCESADYPQHKWPDDYWPEAMNPVPDDVWEKSLKGIAEDRDRFFHLLQNNENKLFQNFPWGSGQHLFREAVLIADHNAYHTAEIVVIRRLLKAWH